MKDNEGKITYKDKEYRVVFNLNVMEELQEKYGTVDKWIELTSGVDQEADVKALKFGYTAMLNEGLEIDAEEKGVEFKPITLKFVGRMLTDIGLDNMRKVLQDTVIESTKTDEGKNA